VWAERFAHIVIIDSMLSSVGVVWGMLVCTIGGGLLEKDCFWSSSLLQYDRVTVSSLLHTAITFKKKKKNAFVA
jgi:hypothetical protein